MKKILAYRILNFKQANSVIELFLANSGKQVVHFNPSQMASFNAACTMLLNSNEVYYDHQKSLFGIRTSADRLNESQDVIDFLNDDFA